MSWPLIPPSSFYNLPSGPPNSLCQLPTAAGPCSPSLLTAPIVNPQIDPTLMAPLPPVGKSAPATPAAPSMEIPAPSDPSSNPFPPVSKCKLPCLVPNRRLCICGPVPHSRHNPLSLHADSCHSSLTVWPCVPMSYEAKKLGVSFLYR